MGCFDWDTEKWVSVVGHHKNQIFIGGHRESITFVPRRLENGAPILYNYVIFYLNV
jgi:hypothetical protein